MRVLALVAILINLAIGGLAVIEAIESAVEWPAGAHPSFPTWLAALATLCLLNVAVAGAYVRHRLGERRAAVVPVVVSVAFGLVVLGGWVAVLGPWGGAHPVDSTADGTGAGARDDLDETSGDGATRTDAIAPELAGTTLEGDRWRLRDEAGRMVVLTVWHTRSLVALGHLGYLSAFRERRDLEDTVALVSVVVDDEPEIARSILGHLDAGGPVIHEPRAAEEHL